MENTYTYTARSVADPEKVATFTLHDHSMSVGLGVPLEQIERLLEKEAEEAGAEQDGNGRLWLKPLAVALVERGSGPFGLSHVSAQAEDGRLRVRAWYEAGGLGLAPITLMDGQVDNPEAAHAFVEEVDRRKQEVGGPVRILGPLDYWATWIAAGMALFAFLGLWRRRNE